MSGGSLKQAADQNQSLMPFRFYMMLTDSDAPGQVATFRFVSIRVNGEESGTTAIESIEQPIDDEEVIIYDLQGRRVINPTKGIYIVNGKKMVIK